MKWDIALPCETGTPISFPYLNVVSTLVYSVVTTTHDLAFSEGQVFVD